MIQIYLFWLLTIQYFGTQIFYLDFRKSKRHEECVLQGHSRGICPSKAAALGQAHAIYKTPCREGSFGICLFSGNWRPLDFQFLPFFRADSTYSVKHLENANLFRLSFYPSQECRKAQQELRRKLGGFSCFTRTQHIEPTSEKSFKLIVASGQLFWKSWFSRAFYHHSSFLYFITWILNYYSRQMLRRLRKPRSQPLLSRPERAVRRLSYGIHFESRFVARGCSDLLFQQLLLDYSCKAFRQQVGGHCKLVVLFLAKPFCL